MTTSTPAPPEARKPADKQSPPLKPVRDVNTQAAIIRDLRIPGALFEIARCPETHPMGAKQAV